jgi:hypothetical protein
MTCAKHCRHQPCPIPYDCRAITKEGGATVEDGSIQFIGPEPEPSYWPFAAIAGIACFSFIVWILR